MGAGKQIGEFEVLRELGRGGMGVVYEVRHPSHTGRLALKLILGEGAGSEALLRFGREAELLARVRHPGVVRVHSLGQAPQGPYIVMDLVEGEDLRRSSRGQPLEPREAARIVREVADAVAAIHQAKIVHRDLKPANVLLRADTGRPVLLDFGIARGLDLERLTQTGAMIGSPGYMAPEQADGMSPRLTDARTDVYGLGTILFTLLAGHPPFEGGGMVALLRKVLEEDPAWPSGPAPLLAILRLAMAKDREDRYASAAALRDDLDRFLGGESVHATQAASPLRWVAPTLVAVLLAVLALGVGSFAAPGVEPRTPVPDAGLQPAAPLVELAAPAILALDTGRPVHAEFGPGSEVVTWIWGEPRWRVWDPGSGAVRIGEVRIGGELRPLRFLTVDTDAARREAFGTLERAKAGSDSPTYRVDLVAGEGKGRWAVGWDISLPAPNIDRLVEPSNFGNLLRVRRPFPSRDANPFLQETLCFGEGQTRQPPHRRASFERLGTSDRSGAGGPSQVLAFAGSRLVAATVHDGAGFLCSWRLSSSGWFGAAVPVAGEDRYEPPGSKVELTAPARALALDRTGSRCALAQANGELLSLDLKTEERLARVVGQPGALSVAFVDEEGSFCSLSPDGLSLWSPSGEPQGTLRWPEGQRGLRSVKVLNGRALISARGRAELWRVADLREAAADGAVAGRLWALREEVWKKAERIPAPQAVPLKVEHQYPFGEEDQTPAWSVGARAVDADRVITWDVDVRLWDRWIDVPTRRFGVLNVSEVAVDGDAVFATGPGPLAEVELYTLDFNGHHASSVAQLPRQPGERCVGLVRLPDGRYAVGTEIWQGEPSRLSQRAGRLFVLDPSGEVGARRDQLAEVSLPVTDMQLSKDLLLVTSGRTFEDGSDGKPNGRLHIYRFQGAGKRLVLLSEHEHKGRMRAVCAEPDGAYAWTLDEERRLLRFDLGSGEQVKGDELTAVAGTGSAMLGDAAAHETMPTALRLLPGGRLLSAGTNELRVWSLDQRTCLLHLHSLDPLWDVRVEHGLLVLSFVRQETRPARVEVWPLQLLEPGEGKSYSFERKSRPFRREPR